MSGPAPPRRISPVLHECVRRDAISVVVQFFHIFTVVAFSPADPEESFLKGSSLRVNPRQAAADDRDHSLRSSAP